MMRVHHLEDYVVAGLELAHLGFELVLGGRGLPVDVGDNQTGFEALQVSERARAHRFDFHAGSVNPANHCLRKIAHHQAQLGFTGIA